MVHNREPCPDDEHQWAPIRHLLDNTKDEICKVCGETKSGEIVEVTPHALVVPESNLDVK